MRKLLATVLLAGCASAFLFGGAPVALADPPITYTSDELKIECAKRGGTMSWYADGSYSCRWQDGWTTLCWPEVPCKNIPPRPRPDVPKSEGNAPDQPFNPGPTAPPRPSTAGNAG